MKHTFLTLLMALMIAGFATAQETYTMYETNYLTPKEGMGKTLHDNLVAHNKKFHAAAPYEAWVSYVAVGASEGDFVWGMGPTTFTALDSRPDDEAHNQDWAVNVSPYVEKSGITEYWKKKDDLSYTPAGENELKLQHIRFWGVKPGKYEAFMGVLKNVVEVFKTNKYPESWGIYVNQFSTGDGRDIASVSNMANWASFDSADTWVADYEKLYGKGSWKTAMATIYDSTDEYSEEVRERQAE